MDKQGGSCNEVNQRVDGIEHKMEELEGKIGDLGTQQRQGHKNHGGRITTVEGKVGSVEGRVTKIGIYNTKITRKIPI